MKQNTAIVVLTIAMMLSGCSSRMKSAEVNIAYDEHDRYLEEYVDNQRVIELTGLIGSCILELQMVKSRVKVERELYAQKQISDSDRWPPVDGPDLEPRIIKGVYPMRERLEDLEARLKRLKREKIAMAAVLSFYRNLNYVWDPVYIRQKLEKLEQTPEPAAR